MVLTVEDLHSNLRENNNDVSFNKDVEVGDKLIVRGDTSLQDTNVTNMVVSDNMTIDGETTLNNNIVVNGNIAFNNQIDIQQNLKVVGTFTVESETSFEENVSLDKNLLVSNTLTTNNIPIINRTFNVKFNGTTFLLNDIPSYELSPVFNIGDSILFIQDDNSNVVGSTKHPLLISSHHTNDVLFEASQNNIIEYKSNDIQYDNVLLYESALTNDTTRSVLFKPQVEGTYFYHNKNEPDAGGTFTVVKNDNIYQHINKDLSLNNNNVEFDFSSNFVPGKHKRIQLIFHPDY